MKRCDYGHYMYKYDYNHGRRSYVQLQIKPNHIEYRKQHSLDIKCKFYTAIRIKDISGILIGDKSSMFVVYKKYIDSYFGKLHEPWDCFSLVTHSRTYDFASTSL